ncbi:hypothetical protein CCHR01_07660 [Colletotrichum chrysophilum]|uniref:Uncharacterized protein n=1 Tax=Colletotrichum chrysophilum TaxID=1836956 RepID=A0AAD9AK49_9PEZI|nr:hypothetical protein CCHR01_07660 [Colletotrichum chrysophilum]
MIRLPLFLLTSKCKTTAPLFFSFFFPPLLFLTLQVHITHTTFAQYWCSANHRHWARLGWCGGVLVCSIGFGGGLSGLVQEHWLPAYLGSRWGGRTAPTQ